MNKNFEIISNIREWAVSNGTYEGIHGLEHWDRVFENGQKLKTTGVNDLVVGAFAYLHDICRINDGEDPEHGLRASIKIDEIREDILQSLSDEEISQLKTACRFHTSKHRVGDITIDTCFDADRLDLWRVGIVPDPSRMATDKGAEIARETDYSQLVKSEVIDIDDEEDIAFPENELNLKIPRRIKRMIYIFLFLLAVVGIKTMNVAYNMKNIGSIESEKEDILMRANYLKEQLTVSPNNVLDAMPAGIGSQFQGEWALYSCSMYCKSLVNIAHLYPEIEENAIETIDKLIEIVMSDELRRYDKERWGEDPIDGMGGSLSHISYYSHLAWMIGGFKEINGGTKYDDIYHDLCAAMNKRILESPILNVQTYPGEVVYVPDMLVAIVALHQYSRFNNGKYSSTVESWKQIMKDKFTDANTGLIASFISESENYSVIKGSYSALNTYYLALVDEEYGKQQYDLLKKFFFQYKPCSGLREYHDDNCWFGLDIDAGPIIMNLSPSGTAFALGSITYFGDNEIRKSFLKTAEIAASTWTSGNKRHYILANLALVGEAITLAMRTSYPQNYKNK